MRNPLQPGWIWCDRGICCGVTGVEDIGQDPAWVCEECTRREQRIQEATAAAYRAQVSAHAEALTNARRTEWLQVYCAAVTGWATVADTPGMFDASKWASDLADAALEAADEKFPLKAGPEGGSAV